jgi:predicted transcriptional regulator
MPWVPINELPGIPIAAGILNGFSRRFRAMSDNQAEASSAKPRRNRTALKAADRKSVRADGRTKATLLLPDSVDFRLTTIAASMKSDRSTLATQLIDAGLRRFALDAALRQHTGGEVAESERAGE